MKAIIAKMRADWPVIAKDRRECGDWSEADENEIGNTIAETVKKGDLNEIILWARWLADLSALTLGLQAVAKGVSDKMREQVRQAREEKERAKAA